MFLWETTEALPHVKFVDKAIFQYLPRAAGLLAPSEVVTRNIRSTYGYDGPIKRLPFWSDPPTSIPPTPNSRSGQFLYVGRMDMDKGFQYLFEAFAAVRSDHPAATLAVCGGGDIETIQSLAHGIPGIEFRGYVGDDAYERALAGCDALLLPSLHEGYPLSLLEACARRKPIIATRVGSIPEVFEGRACALLVPPRDSSALSAAMSQLLCEDAGTYGARCHDAGQTFEQISSPTAIEGFLRRGFEAPKDSGRSWYTSSPSGSPLVEKGTPEKPLLRDTVEQIAHAPQTLPLIEKNGATPSIGIFFSHPTQHHSVMFKHLSEVPDIATRIYYYDYGSLKGAFDPGYGTSESWDVDLLSGTPTKFLPNLLRGKQISQFRQFNPRVVGALLRGRFDAVFVSGYVSPSNWLVLLGAKLLGAKVFYQSDTNILDEERKPQSRLKSLLRRAFLNRVNVFLPIGDHNREVYTRLGYDPQNMVWCPCPVDVERFRGALDNAQTKAASQELRARYDIPDGAKIVAFCGKLIERKRPQDLIDAVKSLGRSDVYALLIGSGPMEAELRAHLSPADPVRITGFVNQSQMPAHMMLADVGVVCSEWDPHPLVVTEFAACGLPILAAHFCGMWGPNDILRPDENGFVYPCGEVAELARCITRLVDDPALAARMGARSLELSGTQSAKYGAQIVAEQLRNLRS